MTVDFFLHGEHCYIAERIGYLAESSGQNIERAPGTFSASFAATSYGQILHGHSRMPTEGRLELGCAPEGRLQQPWAKFQCTTTPLEHARVGMPDRFQGIDSHRSGRVGLRDLCDTH
jgi:hypothetical protein